MDITPFSLAQAEEIKEDFEDLIDTEFTLSGIVYMVQDVAVSPFDKAGKDKFIDIYNGTRDSRLSLGSHPGGEYDVVLIAYDVDREDDLSYMNIRDLVAEKGISYNFPS